ncbi:MAG: hypothetical protein WAX14_07950 [Rhodococcus sp. (in: high G+C Gram-positive bacteria)]|uniref:hypothetical protein n=1 Tax=Rhodococcus sp. TaxID=1831 RepID=UPI003BB57072
MSKSRTLIAATILSALPLFGMAGTATAESGRNNDNRCDVAIVNNRGDVVRIDEKSPGTRIDGLRCDDGLWVYTTDGHGFRRGDIAAVTLVRER